MALATFDQVKSFLELKKAAITDYPTLSILLPLLQGVFEKNCSREFDLKERTKTFRVSDDDGQSSFWLKATPIVSVSSITVDGDAQTLTDDYLIFDEYIELVSDAVKGSTVVIVYIGGLVDQTDDTTLVDTIPADLNLAMIQQVAYQYQNRSKLAATKISLDTNSTTVPGLVLLPYTKQTLEDYYNWGSGF